MCSPTFDFHVHLYHGLHCKYQSSCQCSKTVYNDSGSNFIRQDNTKEITSFTT